MNRDELEKNINKLRGDVEHNEMMINEMSKLLYYRFISLRNAGFSEEQAFTIVLQRGLV